ncbi:MAG: TIGR02444 family protein [Brevundimonas sp.]
MSLWDWALTAYAAEGVADACLELQDAAGQNIPLLLWAAWCAHTGRTLDEDALEAAGDTARAPARAAAAPARRPRTSWWCGRSGRSRRRRAPSCRP